MAMVCSVCHWPRTYLDEETMRAEKCDYCPAADAVQLAITSLEKEEQT